MSGTASPSAPEVDRLRAAEAAFGCNALDSLGGPELLVNDQNALYKYLLKEKQVFFNLYFIICLK